MVTYAKLLKEGRDHGVIILVQILDPLNVGEKSG
jgi:hypothetical protein